MKTVFNNQYHYKSKMLSGDIDTVEKAGKYWSENPEKVKEIIKEASYEISAMIAYELDKKRIEKIQGKDRKNDAKKDFTERDVVYKSSDERIWTRNNRTGSLSSGYLESGVCAFVSCADSDVVIES